MAWPLGATAAPVPVAESPLCVLPGEPVPPESVRDISAPTSAPSVSTPARRASRVPSLDTAAAAIRHAFLPRRIPPYPRSKPTEDAVEEVKVGNWLGMRRAPSLTMPEYGDEYTKAQEEFAEEQALGMEQESLQKRSRRLLLSSRFNLFIGLVIMANTVLMGVEIDCNPLARAEDTMISPFGTPNVQQAVFDVCEVIFFFIFAAEFFFRAFVHRWQMLREVSTYIDLAALSPVLMILFRVDVTDTKQLTLLRIVRLVKLTRILRLIRLFKELNLLVLSIASAARALIWIGCLLFIVLYCGAIACTQIIGHADFFQPEDPLVQKYEATYGEPMHTRRYWGSITRSMFTLFQIFTLDEWSPVVRPIIESHSPVMTIFFVVFLFVTSFGLLNLLMGTIVDKAMSIAREAGKEREKVIQEDYKQVMLVAVRLFSLMDSDGNGSLSSKEIADFLSTNDLQEVLERELKGFKIKLDCFELMDICHHIIEEWETGDDEDEAGITMEEFAGAAVKLQGQAKSKDLLTMMINQKTLLARVQHCEGLLQDVASTGERLHGRFDELLGMLRFGFDGAQGFESISNPLARLAGPKQFCMEPAAKATVPAVTDLANHSSGGAAVIQFPGRRSQLSDDDIHERISQRSKAAAVGSGVPMGDIDYFSPLRTTFRSAVSSNDRGTFGDRPSFDGDRPSFNGSLNGDRPSFNADRPSFGGDRSLLGGDLDQERNLFGADYDRPSFNGGRGRRESASQEHTLRDERGMFKKSGQKFSKLFKELSTYDEYSKTPSHVAIRAYEQRRQDYKERAADGAVPASAEPWTFAKRLSRVRTGTDGSRRLDEAPGPATQPEAGAAGDAETDPPGNVSVLSPLVLGQVLSTDTLLVEAADSPRTLLAELAEA